MKIKSMIVVSVLMLAACASQPPGVSSWDYDGFTLSVPVDSSTDLAGPKKLAMIDAETHCRRLNSTIVFLSSDVKTSGQPGQSILEIIYRCPSKRFS